LEESYEEPPTDVVSRPPSSCSSFGKSEDTFKVIIPFSALQEKTVKCGPLKRREKVVCSHQWRSYWTGLCEHFLLMYASQRDVKPCASVNIQGFVARPVSNSNMKCKKKDAAFEIVCPGKRNYQVVYINTHCSLIVVVAKVPRNDLVVYEVDRPWGRFCCTFITRISVTGERQIDYQGF
jgi:hypothetical protein